MRQITEFYIVMTREFLKFNNFYNFSNNYMYYAYND
jgi:hypothetical protein